jgi:AraC family transcriptional regulator
MNSQSRQTNKSQTRTEYIGRINKVVDYINANIQSTFTLDELAEQSCFSKYHFHRIFGSLMDEPLGQFIHRIRLEKAASLLANNFTKSVTEVLLDCGFSSAAHFSRVFKDRFNESPSEWRKKHQLKSKNSQLISNVGEEFKISSYYVNDVNFQQQWRIVMNKHKEANVEIKELPEMTVAYVRHIGPYEADEKLFESLFTKLMNWAGPRDLIKFPKTQMLSIYHDDPEVTEKSKLRTDCCISVPHETEVDGEIGKTNLPGGKYAVTRFELSADEYGEAWQAVMSGWLPESGYQCDDRPMFELYQNNPKDHPEGKHIVDFCVPVKPM